MKDEKFPSRSVAPKDFYTIRKTLVFYVGMGHKKRASLDPLNDYGTVQLFVGHVWMRSLRIPYSDQNLKWLESRILFLGLIRFHGVILPNRCQLENITITPLNQI